MKKIIKDIFKQFKNNTTALNEPQAFMSSCGIIESYFTRKISRKELKTIVTRAIQENKMM